MNNLNSVLIEGNLVKDPDRFSFNNGTMAKFGIGVNRYYRNAAKEPMKETSFITIQTWGALAEGCCRYLKKGRGVRVVGRLKQEKWTENGIARDRHVIVAEHVEFKPEPKEHPEVPQNSVPTTENGNGKNDDMERKETAMSDTDLGETIVLEQTQGQNDALAMEELPEEPVDPVSF